MKKPQTVKSLEELGRVRLSKNFFMRDFLHSEISQIEGIPNIPDNPDLAIASGKSLCEQVLEPAYMVDYPPAATLAPKFGIILG